MKLINANDVYYDNDFEKWYFEDDKDFENAQVVDDNYGKENQKLKKQLAEKDKEIERLKKNMEFDTAYYVKELVNVRKQVCSEIRDRLKDKLHNYYPSIDYVCMSVHAYKSNEIKEILDQIEGNANGK